VAGRDLNPCDLAGADLADGDGARVAVNAEDDAAQLALRPRAAKKKRPRIIELPRLKGEVT
jgi:hypothetical protein